MSANWTTARQRGHLLSQAVQAASRLQVYMHELDELPSEDTSHLEVVDFRHVTEKNVTDVWFAARDQLGARGVLRTRSDFDAAIGDREDEHGNPVVVTEAHADRAWSSGGGRHDSASDSGGLDSCPPVLPLEAPAPGGHEVSSRVDWKPGGTRSPHTKPSSRERGCAEGYDREMDQTLFDVVSILTDYRSVRAFDCRAEVRLGDSLTVYRLHAEPSIDSYEVSSSDGLVVGSYIASRGLVYDGGETFPYDPRGVVWRALPARLAFPLELPIWGRSGDSHRLDAAEMQNDGGILVTLAPNRDREGRGRLVVDPSLKLVTEFDVPNLEIRYRDVEPGRGRLLVP